MSQAVLVADILCLALCGSQVHELQATLEVVQNQRNELRQQVGGLTMRRWAKLIISTWQLSAQATHSDHTQSIAEQLDWCMRMLFIDPSGQGGQGESQ
jgi:hypothetical protein